MARPGWALTLASAVPGAAGRGPAAWPSDSHRRSCARRSRSSSAPRASRSSCRRRPWSPSPLHSPPDTRPKRRRPDSSRPPRWPRTTTRRRIRASGPPPRPRPAPQHHHRLRPLLRSPSRSRCPPQGTPRRRARLRRPASGPPARLLFSTVPPRDCWLGPASSRRRVRHGHGPTRGRPLVDRRHHLGETASDAEVARAWPRWYATNRSIIGDDPTSSNPAPSRPRPEGDAR